jgi:hypothetical protein
VIYLYAIAEELAELPPVAGVAGATLERRTVDGLELVVSALDGAALEPTEETLLAHARVVDELVPRAAALLPARFGRAFSGDEVLADAIRSRADALRDALGLVRGRVELGVRVVGEEEPAAVAESGRAYMEARLARSAERERLAEEIHRPLAALARASTRTVAARPRLVFSGAYLLEPGDVEAFEARVAELRARHPELAVACTGPWPAYSFAPGEGT